MADYNPAEHDKRCPMAMDSSVACNCGAVSSDTTTVDPLHKRYLVFAFGRYYPQGGMNDVKAEADTEDGAFELAKSFTNYEFVQVLDCVQRCVIWERS